MLLRSKVGLRVKEVEKKLKKRTRTQMSLDTPQRRETWGSKISL